MAKVKRTWHIVKNAIYYALLSFLIFIIAVSIFVPAGLVKVVGFGWYRVVSESMEPIIMVDDYIVVTRLDDISSLEEGDIIVFETYFYHQGSYGKRVVTHHFGGYDNEGHILTYPHAQHGLEKKTYDTWRKGPGQKYYVTEADIIGTHAFTISTHPIFSFFTFLLTNPFGISIVVINIGVIIGIVYLYKTEKKNKIDKTNDEEESDQNDVGDPS